VTASLFGDREPGSPVRICICGGGSLSHALAAVLGARPWIEVRVLSRQPHRWSDRIRLIYLDKAELIGRVVQVSADPAAVIPGADLVIVSVPHAARRELLQRIAHHLDSEAWLAGFPGFGGFASVVREVFGPARPLLGLQRVPYVRKVVSYGQVVWVSGIRPELFVATIPAGHAEAACRWLSAMLNIPATAVASYIAVCLTNSNPIFHPARLHALWRSAPRDIVWRQRPQFYEDWDDTSSELYLACDEELQAIARALRPDGLGVRSLLEHYRLSRPDQLTPTIRALAALRDRPVPMLATQGGFTPDVNAYYFTEDVPYGIVLQRAIAELAGVHVPVMDRIIAWAQRWMGRNWLEGGCLSGPDMADLPTPQRAGVTSGEALVRWMS